MMIFEDNENHTTNSTSCKVCGDKACIFHYGVLTCNSCKTFFSRYALKPELASQCLFRGECKINIQTRAVCLACRLKKCFNVGMGLSSVQKKYRINKHNRPSNENRNTQMVLASQRILNAPLPTLSLLRQDRSTLTTSQWTILSNVVHAYDTFSPMTQMNHIMKQMSELSIQFPPNNAPTLGLLQFMLISTQVFIRSLPDFQVLTLPEQQSLFQRNLHSIVGLNSGFLGRELGLFDTSQLRPAIESIYNMETMIRLRRLINQLDSDCTLLKLTLVIVSFSSSCLIFNVPTNCGNDVFLSGTFRLYGSQNIYVELLWKYMLYRYGYRDTVIRFSYIIKRVLDEVNNVFETYTDNECHQAFMNDAFDVEKRSFVTDLDENVPLWGNI